MRESRKESDSRAAASAAITVKRGHCRTWSTDVRPLWPYSHLLSRFSLEFIIKRIIWQLFRLFDSRDLAQLSFLGNSCSSFPRGVSLPLSPSLSISPSRVGAQQIRPWQFSCHSTERIIACGGRSTKNFVVNLGNWQGRKRGRERETGKTVDCRADKVGQCEFIMMMLCRWKEAGRVYKA